METTVIIGDIVHSSAIRKRSEFQKKFKRVVEELNRRCNLASPYTVTLGDEFQAVYRDATLILDHAFTLIAKLLPHRLRISIGVGPLTTELNPRQSIGMDGPAFYVARAGIELLRASGESMCVCAAGYDVGLEDCAVRLISRQVHKWRSTRWQVLRGLVNAQSVGVIAGELGMTPAAVYKNIREGSLELLLATGREVGKSLTGKTRGRK